MPDIVFQRRYLLNEEYEGIKERAEQVLHKYRGYPDLITFNNFDRSVTFSSERLIPAPSTNRPRVMLLFSNPHPHSIHQGMFLSPNTNRQENLFWPVMGDAGWLPIAEENRHPRQLADICLKAEYAGPFELIFYCYFAFPTDYPEHIKRIFGRKYFSQFIEPEALDEFRKTVQETSVAAVVTFNKGIFNLVSRDPIERYVERLMAGKLIQSQIEGMDRYVPIFLTFPTGWRYHGQYKQFRKDSLDTIRKAIMITIRDYRDSDAECTGKLIADTYRDFNLSFAPPEQRNAFLGPFQYAASPEKSHQDAIASVIRASMVFVAEKDGEVVGVLRGRKDKLQSLFVRGDLHRQGIGRRLVERFEQECVHQGAEVIRLMSTLYAVPFYQAMGYQKSTGVRRMKSFEGEGLEYQPMKKILQRS